MRLLIIYLILILVVVTGIKVSFGSKDTQNTHKSNNQFASEYLGAYGKE